MCNGRLPAQAHTIHVEALVVSDQTSGRLVGVVHLDGAGCLPQSAPPFSLDCPWQHDPQAADTAVSSCAFSIVNSSCCSSYTSLRHGRVKKSTAVSRCGEPDQDGVAKHACFAHFVCAYIRSIYIPIPSSFVWRRGGNEGTALYCWLATLFSLYSHPLPNRSTGYHPHCTRRPRETVREKGACVELCTRPIPTPAYVGISTNI